MNYIAEIKAFYDWTESNPISAPCFSLWHALLYQANKSGWKTEFTVAISTLELRTGLKKGAIYTARNKLKQLGAISFKERTGNLSASYEILSLCPFNERNPDANTNTNQTQSDTQSEHKVSALYKLNKTKQNNNESKEASTPKRPEIGYADLINNFTDNEELKSAVWAFIQMRISIKKKPTNRALELIFKHLSELSADIPTQIKILEQSIVKSWQDVFALKSYDNYSYSDKGKHGGESNGYKEVSEEDRQAIRAQLEACEMREAN